MAPLTAGIYLILLFASLAYNYNFVLIDYIRPFLVRHAGMTLTDTAWLYIAQGSGVLLASFVVPVPVGAAAPAVAALLTVFLLPDDRRYMVWASLPETLRTGRLYRGFAPSRRGGRANPRGDTSQHGVHPRSGPAAIRDTWRVRPAWRDRRVPRWVAARRVLPGDVRYGPSR